MSKVVRPETKELAIDPELVKEYLLQHPDFFSVYPELITQLQIPHVAKGAISLLEKRQEVQRAKITQMEEEHSILVDNARANEVIFKAISQIYISLVGCESIANLEKAVEQVCQEHLYLANFRLLQPEDEAYLHLQAKLTERGTYLGRLAPDLMDAVFETQSGSVALIEVVNESEEVEEIYGIAAFAAKQSDHFQPQMDTFFIRELARLLSRHFVHIVGED
jgi:hypothetical protein